MELSTDDARSGRGRRAVGRGVAFTAAACARLTSARPGPVRTGRMFRFGVVDNAKTVGVRNRHREEVAEYLEEWHAARIVTEHFDGDGGRCWLTLVTERPVAVDKAATICQDCPRYVRGSFSCVDG